MSSHFARSKQLIIIKTQQLTFYYLFDNQQINNFTCRFFSNSYLYFNYFIYICN